MSNKAGIPSWQRAQPTTPSPSSTSEQEPKPESQAESPPAAGTEESTTDVSQSDSASLLQQASTFLEDPTIRDAPREKKVAFLQSKGLQSEDIEKLLGKQEDASVDLSKDGERAWSKVC